MSPQPAPNSLLKLLVRSDELAETLGTTARQIGAKTQRFHSGDDVAKNDQGSDLSAWIIEADLLSDARSREKVGEFTDEASEVILVGDPDQREHVEGWLSTGKAIFLRTPVDRAYLSELLRDILSEQGRRSKAADTVPEPELDQFGLLFGSAALMRELYRHLRKAAQTDATLLILGESGTGKELIARSVHNYSQRSDDGFESINCGAIPAGLLESELFGHEKGSFSGADRSHRGLFERAAGGTLFLDEITEMPLSAQVKLLRVLETSSFRRVGGEEERGCTARIIAASNLDPGQAIASGELREDLYYRLRQMEIQAPPLRDRGEDIVHLARLFVRQYSNQTELPVSLSSEAEALLMQHSWPGNVRELRHTILSAARFSRGLILPKHIHDLITDVEPTESEPAGSGRAITPGMRIEEVERMLIEATLDHVQGDKPRAAEMLGISVRTLYNRLKTYR